MTRITVLCCFWIVALAACGDGTGAGERPQPGLRVLSGAGVADTVGAWLAQPVVVELRDERGKVLAGAPLRFEGVRNPTDDFASVYLAAAPAGQASVVVELATDSRGRASVYVRLGFRAGEGEVAVSAPGLGHETRGGFTIQPGSPARIQIAPRDTALYVGGGFQPRAALVDRWGNPHPAAPVSFSTGSNRVSVAAGAVNGVAIGRATVLAAAGGITDSLRVSVVPVGTLAAIDGGRFVGDSTALVVFGLDGSGYRRVVGAGRTGPEYDNLLPHPPRWSPDGTRLVYALGPSYAAPWRVYVTGRNESPRPLVESPYEATSEATPAFSPDGRWIYYTGSAAAYNEGLWRVAAAGGAPERLLGGYAYLRFARPMPDGGVYFTARRHTWEEIRTHRLDPATGTVTRLPAGTPTPVPSPGGGMVAYVTDGGIHVRNADGSGDRMLVAGSFWSVDWSPDEAWLVAGSLRGLELVEVSTGERLPLGYAAGHRDAAWADRN